MDTDRYDRWSRSVAARAQRPRGDQPPPPRFDALARWLDVLASRRRVLGATLAALLARRLPALSVAARQAQTCPCPDPPCILHAWGGGDFVIPNGVATAPDGTVYVAEDPHRILHYDAFGTLLGAWGSEGSGWGQFSSPSGVAVTPDGTVYVTDAGNHRIQVFTGDGAFIRTWGREGSGDGQFITPLALAVASDGTVYVSDFNNHRVQYFDRDGTFLGAWGSQGTGAGQLSFPIGVAVAPDGQTVYVADAGNHRIQAFCVTPSAAGDRQRATPVAGTPIIPGPAATPSASYADSPCFLFTWGGEGTGDGEFAFPTGVAVAPDGTVFVADQANSRIQAFCVNPSAAGDRPRATLGVGTPVISSPVATPVASGSG